MVVIPVGCTGLIQAPDIYWNKSFKARLKEYHTEWLVNDKVQYMKGSNMKRALFETN